MFVQFNFLMIILSSGFSLVFSEFSVFPNLPFTVRNTTNTVCNADSDLYVENLHNFTLWAYEMWDSTAKTTFGVLRAQKFNFGHFEQCLTARAPFSVKYCLVKMTANIPEPSNRTGYYRPDKFSLDYSPYASVLSRIYPYDVITQQARNIIHMGWCIPDSCTNTDLEQYLDQYLNENHQRAEPNITFSVKSYDVLCQNDREQDEKDAFGPLDLYFCGLVGTLIGLVFTATCFDYNRRKSEKNQSKNSTTTAAKLFLSFSAWNGYDSLRKMPDDHQPLQIFYGLRTICMLIIVTAHRFTTTNSSSLLNYDYFERTIRSPYATFLLRSVLVVDVFFFMSGVFVVYGLLGQLNRKFMNPVLIVIGRYLRLTPIVAFVAFFYVTLLPKFANGPIWKAAVVLESQKCRDNWWASLLYVHNYVNANRMCMPHTWYLAVDFQCFLIGLFVCFLIAYRRKLGLFVLFALITLSALVPFLLTWYYRYPPFIIINPDLANDTLSHPVLLRIYVKTHMRTVPYFVGMAFGYLYHKWRSTNTHISRVWSNVILTASTVLLITSVMTGAIFIDPYHEYNAIEAATYAASFRLMFALGIGGVFLVASYGHAQIVRTVLMWSPLITLSKLTYAVYVSHFQFPLRSIGRMRTSINFSFFEGYRDGFGDLFLGYVSALFLYICIEAPTVKIVKLLLGHTTDKEKRQTATTVGHNVQITMPSGDCEKEKN